MPWYTNSIITCKVLHKLADQNEGTDLQDLKSVLDNAAALIWEKQEHYMTMSSTAEGRKSRK